MKTAAIFFPVFTFFLPQPSPSPYPLLYSQMGFKALDGRKKNEHYSGV